MKDEHRDGFDLSSSVSEGMSMVVALVNHHEHDDKVEKAHKGAQNEKTCAYALTTYPGGRKVWEKRDGALNRVTVFTRTRS